MKKIALLSVLLMFLAEIVTAQVSAENRLYIFGKDRGYRDTVWIIGGRKPLDGNFHKWKMDLILDARYTLVSNTRARLAGIRIGMEFRRVHRFGLGIYYMVDGVPVTSYVGFDNGKEMETALISLNYVSLFYERVMYFHPRFEFSVTGHVGVGKVTGEYRSPGSDELKPLPERAVQPIELSTSGYFHPAWWLSVGGGIGYRVMGNAPTKTESVYNAPVAIAKVRIRLGRLVKSIWDKDVKNEY